MKSERRKKKINEFDEIDKEFKKKEMLLTEEVGAQKEEGEKSKCC